MAKPLIMVVEDEVSYAEAVSSLLKNSGRYDAVIANSAKDAFETLKKNKRMFGVLSNKIRCILLDIKMPEMDGLQFLEKLRKEHPEKIAVIMVTAYEDAEKWDKATDGRVAGYIKKPYKGEELLGKLDRLFSDQFAQEEMIADTDIESFDKVKGKNKE